MEYKLAKYAAAGAVVGILGIGGVSIASAQEGDSSSTSTTVQPSTADRSGTPAPDAAAKDAAKDGKDCPMHDQASAETPADSAS